MENIQVALRVRPLSKKELQRGEEIIWKITQNNTICLSPNFHKDLVSTKKLNFAFRVSFPFDYAFSTEANNLQVYNAMVKRIALSSLNGINGTIFMYGQTGSGKTYTMMGYKQDTFDGCNTYNDNNMAYGGSSIVQNKTNMLKFPIRSTDDRYSNEMNDSSKIYEKLNFFNNDKYSTGILIHALQDIFNVIENDMDKTYFLRCSYIEIYNDQIYDLLKTHDKLSETLTVNEDNKKEFFIKGINEESVSSISEILDKLRKGEANRHYAATMMNHTSSRSHTIFRLLVQTVTNNFIREYRRQYFKKGSNINNDILKTQLTGTPEKKTFMNMNSGGIGSANGAGSYGLASGASGCGGVFFEEPLEKEGTIVTESLLNFVDLAGSEKVSNHHIMFENQMSKDLSSDGTFYHKDILSKTANLKERVKEGQHINKSLFFLTQVISLKSEGKSSQHIPYRNSPLTKILRSSLGGNSRTLIILCITPASSQLDQTISTLRFGMNAKKIENKVQANIITNNYDEALKILISDYEKKIRNFENYRQEDQQKYHSLVRQVDELRTQKMKLIEKFNNLCKIQVIRFSESFREAELKTFLDQAQRNFIYFKDVGLLFNSSNLKKYKRIYSNSNDCKSSRTTTPTILTKLNPLTQKPSKESGIIDLENYDKDDDGDEGIKNTNDDADDDDDDVKGGGDCIKGDDDYVKGDDEDDEFNEYRYNDNQNEEEFLGNIHGNYQDLVYDYQGRYALLAYKSIKKQNGLLLKKVNILEECYHTLLKRYIDRYENVLDYQNKSEVRGRRLREYGIRYCDEIDTIYKLQRQLDLYKDFIGIQNLNDNDFLEFERNFMEKVEKLKAEKVRRQYKDEINNIRSQLNLSANSARNNVNSGNNTNANINNTNENESIYDRILQKKERIKSELLEQGLLIPDINSDYLCETDFKNVKTFRLQREEESIHNQFKGIIEPINRELNDLIKIINYHDVNAIMKQSKNLKKIVKNIEHKCNKCSLYKYKLDMISNLKDYPIDINKHGLLTPNHNNKDLDNLHNISIMLNNRQDNNNNVDAEGEGDDDDGDYDDNQNIIRSNSLNNTHSHSHHSNSNSHSHSLISKENFKKRNVSKQKHDYSVKNTTKTAKYQSLISPLGNKKLKISTNDYTNLFMNPNIMPNTSINTSISNANNISLGNNNNNGCLIGYEMKKKKKKKGYNDKNVIKSHSEYKRKFSSTCTSTTNTINNIYNTVIGRQISTHKFLSFQKLRRSSTNHNSNNNTQYHTINNDNHNRVYTPKNPLNPLCLNANSCTKLSKSLSRSKTPNRRKSSSSSLSRHYCSHSNHQQQNDITQTRNICSSLTSTCGALIHTPKPKSKRYSTSSSSIDKDKNAHIETMKLDNNDNPDTNTNTIDKISHVNNGNYNSAMSAHINASFDKFELQYLTERCIENKKKLYNQNDKENYCHEESKLNKLNGLNDNESMNYIITNSILSLNTLKTNENIDILATINQDISHKISNFCTKNDELTGEYYPEQHTHHSQHQQQQPNFPEFDSTRPRRRSRAERCFKK